MALRRFSRVASPRLVQQAQRYSTAAKLASEDSEVKPFSEIPGPSRLVLARDTVLQLAGRPMHNSHWEVYNGFKTFGPIMKVNMPGLKFVWLKDIAAIEKLFRQDGKYPSRILINAWKEFREVNEKSMGILTVNGPQWKRHRRALDKKMLRPKEVKLYTDQFNAVVTDFVERMKVLRDRSPDGVIPQMDMELFNWSLETIGTVLYETRFGGLDDNRQEEMQDFIRAVHKVFLNTEKLFMLPRYMNKVFASSYLKAHDDGWATIFRIGNKYIDKKVAEIDEKLERGEEDNSFLATILSHEDLSQDEVYSSIADLMMAAVDTTSNSMQWVIEMLARHPDIQEKLHQEIISNAPDGQTPSHDCIQNSPYLKAVIKEVLRMYPIAITVTRILNEDTVIMGYQVPANTLVLMGVFQNCRDPEIFPDPNTFMPERWLRGDPEEKKSLHNFAWLPFGFGSRMCLGRRVAELEMHLLTARLVQKFKIVPGDDTPLKEVTSGLLKPDRPVSIKLIDRF